MPGATTIKSISNAGHSVINHGSTCTHSSRATTHCHADSCLPSPPELKQCIFQRYLSCPSVVHNMGVFYQSPQGLHP